MAVRLGRSEKDDRGTKRLASEVSGVHGIEGDRPTKGANTFNRQSLYLSSEYDNFRRRRTHERYDPWSDPANFHRLLDGTSEAGDLANNRTVSPFHSPACRLVKDGRELLVTAASCCSVDH
jgi:hypothetical protein